MLRSHRRIRRGYTDQRIELNISQTQVSNIKESKTNAFVFIYLFRFAKHSHFNSKNNEDNNSSLKYLLVYDVKRKSATGNIHCKSNIVFLEMYLYEKRVNEPAFHY